MNWTELFRRKRPQPTAYSRSWLIAELDKRGDTKGLPLNSVQCARAVNVLGSIFADMGLADAQETVRVMIAEEHKRREKAANA